MGDWHEKEKTKNSARDETIEISISVNTKDLYRCDWTESEMAARSSIGFSPKLLPLKRLLAMAPHGMYGLPASSWKGLQSSLGFLPTSPSS